MSRGERIYSAACIVPDPGFGEPRKHRNHLRLIEHAMTSGLPDALAAAIHLREVFGLLRELPSLGPFLAYQYAVDLAYSPVTAADEMQFVVAGPGALDGISKCFTDTGGLAPADVVGWMRDTSGDHFARLGPPSRPPEMAGQGGNPGGTVGITAPTSPSVAFSAPVRGPLRLRPWPARPRAGAHGRIADGGSPKTRLETHNSRSAASASTRSDGL